MNFLNFLTFDVDVFYSVCNSDSQLRNWRATMVRKWVELKTHFFGFWVLSFSFRFLKWIREILIFSLPGKFSMAKNYFWNEIQWLFSRNVSKNLYSPEICQLGFAQFLAKKSSRLLLSLSRQENSKFAIDFVNVSNSNYLPRPSTFRHFQWRVQKSDKIREINKKAKNKCEAGKLVKMYSRK